MLWNTPVVWYCHHNVTTLRESWWEMPHLQNMMQCPSGGFFIPKTEILDSSLAKTLLPQGLLLNRGPASRMNLGCPTFFYLRALNRQRCFRSLPLHLHISELWRKSLQRHGLKFAWDMHETLYSPEMDTFPNDINPNHQIIVSRKQCEISCWTKSFNISKIISFFALALHLIECSA